MRFERPWSLVSDAAGKIAVGSRSRSDHRDGGLRKEGDGRAGHGTKPETAPFQGILGSFVTWCLSALVSLRRRSLDDLMTNGRFAVPAILPGIQNLEAIR